MKNGADWGHESMDRQRKSVCETVTTYKIIMPFSMHAAYLLQPHSPQFAPQTMDESGRKVEIMS